MTMAEAAQIVLKGAGKAIHIDDIYDEILRRSLNHVGAKDPKAILSQMIRKKSAANAKADRIVYS